MPSRMLGRVNWKVGGGLLGMAGAFLALLISSPALASGDKGPRPPSKDPF